MACKGCKEKKDPVIEQHVTLEIDNGVRKYSFPKWWIVVEWKSMLDALEKAKKMLGSKKEEPKEED
jgi:sialic acid synthase SpsE